MQRKKEYPASVRPRATLWGMLGILATLMLAVGLVFGMGTSTSAKADQLQTGENVTGNFCPFVVLRNNVTGEFAYTYTVVKYVAGSQGSAGTAVYAYQMQLPQGAPFEIEGYHYTGLVKVYSGDTVTEDAYVKTIDMSVANNRNFNIEQYKQLRYVYQYAPDPLPLPEEPTKEGYHFAGWYLGTDEACNGSCTQYTAQTITEDINLHAHFAINTYRITYNVNQGTAVSSATVEWNTAAPMPETTRTGYNFVGWFKADGTQYNGEAVIADMTLTAKWDIKIFTVTFYADGEVYTTVQVPYGSSLVKAMTKAKVASYGVKDAAGTRISKQSAITEDTNVLIHDLTGWEKYGDFVARSPWYTWLMVGIGGAMAVGLAVMVLLLVKEKRG